MSITSTRPELACEIVPEGVIAARRQPNSGLLASAAFAAFGPHAPTAAFAPYLDKDAPRVGLPGVQTGNPQERDAVVQCLRRALESVGGRNGVVTLVVPDQAVRVLMLDFDSLPNKAADAIPLLRFRLKKMVPFDVDDAAVSYQILPSRTGARAVVAVVPNAVLREYETVVREAGFEPGIVLPSTMACLGMITDSDPALIVHASTQCVTTAIAGGQELLLHRTQELPWAQEQLAQTMNPAAGDAQGTYSEPQTLPLLSDEFVTNMDLEERIEELRYPAIMSGMADPATDHDAPYEFVVEVEDSSDLPREESDQPETLLMPEPLATSFQPFEPAQSFETAGPQTLELELADQQSAEDDRMHAEQDVIEAEAGQVEPESDAVHAELHHALAVAAAYFEDAIGHAPNPVLVAGALDARSWMSLLRASEGSDGALQVRDLVSVEDMGTAMDSGLSRAQLGAVCGALRG